MGFYGNITNTSNTTFQFDRIYPNRLAMDANTNNDGIFIGRYVLVEYQQSAAYPIVYIKDNQFYSSPNYEDITRIKFLSGNRKDNTDENNDGYFDGIYKDEFVQTQQAGEDKTTIKFYQCIGAEGEYAVFTAATPDTSKSNYITNFGIDEYHYSNEKGFKGYDSTVWVKSSITTNDGKLITKYVNIADLNSVVPTFDIAADAPTMIPITPHFDADSTNVYYKLHVQTPFGFRIKENNEQSDQTTTHYETIYDKNGNIIEQKIDNDVKADIFYNKNALKYKPNDTSNRVIDEPEGLDEINLTIGKSTNYDTKYQHYTKGDVQGDIQELSIHLPSVGYMVSQGWDIIHGPNRDDDMREFDEEGNNVSSLKGRLDSIDVLEADTIPVKRDADGKLVGNKINGGRTTNTDYTGKDDDAWIETLVNGNEETITIHHTYDLENKSNYKDIGHLEEKLNNNNDTINTIDLNNGTNTININTPIVDTKGHVVGRNTETVTLPYGYKKIVAVNTDKASAAPVNTTDEPTADNTQDTLKLTASNKWIKFSTENTEDNNEIQIGHLLKTVSTTDSEQSLSSEIGATTFEVYNDSFDEAGHHKGRDTKTVTMPFGYGKIKGDSGKSEASATYDEFSVLSGDNWIETEVTKDTITITHTGPVVSTVETKINVENPSFGSTFTIEDWHFDDKGHMHTSGKTHTVQFPEGSIKHPNSNSSNSEIITALSFNSKNGEISYQKDNSSTLKLTTNYTTNEINAGAISGGDTINTAFAKLEKQVIKETSEREAAVSKEVQDRNTAINTAIANLVDSAPDNLNTLREITEWLDSNKDGTIDITLDIAENAKNIGLETIRAERAEQALGERIDKINSTKSAAADNYISSITISNDTLSIGETALPTYTLATGDNNGQIKFNGNNVDIKGLGSAAFTNSGNYATATQGALAETAIQSTTEFIYTEEFRDSETNEILIPEVKVTIEQLIQKVVDLEAEIKALKGE